MMTEIPDNPEELLARQKARVSAGKAASAETSSVSGRYEWNDTGNAERLCAKHGKDMYWIRQWSAWAVWVGGRWVEDKRGIVDRWATDVQHELLKDGYELKAAAKGDKDREKDAQAALSWGRQCGNRSRIVAMMEVAKTFKRQSSVTAEKFDTDPKLLGCRNGILVLDPSGDKAEFGDYTREDFVTRDCGTEYVDGALSPLWESYLDTFLPETGKRRLVQKLLGYSMYGRNHEKLMVFFQGPGNSGKSTILEMASAVFGGQVAGGYASTMQMTVLRGQFDEGPRSDIANIVRSRFALSSESGNNLEIHADQIKRLSGGLDQITFARKNKDEETVMPQFTMFIATNDTPRIKGADAATANRMCVVEFDQVVPRTSANAKRGTAMVSDAGAREAFLAWCVEGWNMYLAEGLDREEWPESVRKTTAGYRDEMSSTTEFLMDCTVKGDDFEITSAELRAAYELWCMTTGTKPLQASPLGHELGGLEYKRTKVKGARGWSGMKLREPSKDGPKLR